MRNNFDKTLDTFLSVKTKTNKISQSKEVCDVKTGECYTIKPKDGIIERMNKTFITEDGRQLLQD